MKTNQELLDEANKIDFQIKSNGALNSGRHTIQERGLFFIRKAIELHGIDTYQYGMVLQNFKDVTSKVPILCPEHGEFWVTPGNHTGKSSKCPKCSKHHIPTTEEWIESAKKIHGDLYDYSEVVYSGAKVKVRIRCKTHGVFEQTTNNHLTGYGCIRCGNTYSYTTEEWVEKAKAVHGNRYDYSSVVYNVGRDKVLIRCLVHGDFLQEANSHLMGHHCPKCSGHNHDILYLMRCKDAGWYKIGITTKDIKNRIRQIGGNVEEICHVVCNDPRKHESILHKKYARDREYNLCVEAGNTEFFSLNEEQVAQVRQYMASIAINQNSI